MSEPTDTKLRDRMGSYVSMLLPVHPKIVPIKWRLAVHWDEHAIRATLTRGELVLEAGRTRLHWWLPQTRTRAREWVEELADLLAAKHALYADADETGRKRVQAWRDEAGRLNGAGKGEPVSLVLEPGVRIAGDGAQGSGWRVARLEPVATLTLQEAWAWGWLRGANESESQAAP